MSQFSRGPGSLRPSQMVSTFGPGAIYDNLKDSLLIMGTDRWKTKNCKILNDETLLTYLKKNDNRKYSRLKHLLVPISTVENDAQIPVMTFPTWGVCPTCHVLQKRNLANDNQGARCQSARCFRRDAGSQRPPETVPVRFIAACTNGHLEDFPWYRWVHRGKVSDCSESKAVLYLTDDENHLSLESMIVRCGSCNRSQGMGMALSPTGLKFAIPEGCQGSRPWLTSDDSRPCLDSEGKQEHLRGLYKGASNVYFSQNVRAITVPPFAGSLADQIIRLINEYKITEQPDDAIRTNLLPILFPDNNPDMIMDIIDKIKRKRQSESVPDIRRDEFEELNRMKFGQDGVDIEDFKTEPIELPDNFSDSLENLVLVRRLREVIAQTGFRRIEPEGAEEGGSRPSAPITNYPRELPEWLPAVENRGEGIFFSFMESKINEWVRNNHSVLERLKRMTKDSCPSWLNDDDAVQAAKYVFLHSLSHLMIREISNFAGYSASSMRERIYSGKDMSGILIYTSSPSSDGSLGGLVEQGKKPRFNIMLQLALRRTSICSTDPLCSHSQLGVGNRRNGAACHACIFLPETSCECMNDFLDRAFVCPTLSEGMGFFGK